MGLVCQQVCADIVIWHQKEQIADWLGPELARLSLSQPVSVTYMTTDELKAAALRSVYLGTPADLILAPSDFISEHIALQLTPLTSMDIPWQIDKTSLETVSYDQVVFGYPLLKGNHLVLYFRKGRVGKGPSDWRQLFTDNHANPAMASMGWSFQEPYYLLPFLLSNSADFFTQQPVNFQTQETRRAIAFYQSIGRSGLVDPRCDYRCSLRGFVDGDLTYNLNGDWAFRELQQAVGDDLGVTAFPDVDGKAGRAVTTTTAWLLPQKRRDAKTQADIQRILTHFGSASTQLTLQRKTGLIPANQRAFAQLLATSEEPYLSLLKAVASAQPVIPNAATTAIISGLKKGLHYQVVTKSSLDEALTIMQKTAEREIARQHRPKGRKTGL